MDYFVTMLTVWIITHVIAREIPLTANGPKPLSCQLCLSGWFCIALGVLCVARGGLPASDAIAAAGALWAGAVLTEAVWLRMNTFIS